MRLHDVWFRYDRRGPWVLRAASVRIEPGRVAIVLGRNGAGKSTLLQLAAGVLRPVRGAVLDRPGRWAGCRSGSRRSSRSRRGST